MSNGIKVNPTEINMTPNGEVVWHVTDVAGGKLYTPSSTTLDADPLVLFQHFQRNPSNLERIGFGGEGSIHAIGDYVIKHYNTPENPRYHAGENTYGSISDLRANVALAEGLKHVEQLHDIDYDVRGAEIHAAFIPDTPYISKDGAEQTQALWLMERLYDTYYDFGECLNNQERQRLRRLYDAALNLFSIPDFAVEYDDQKNSGNTMVTGIPTANNRGKLVKYDSYALENWLDF